MLKPVFYLGVETDYEVSDTGFIHSKITDKILAPETTKNGYMRVNLHVNDELGNRIQKKFSLHRLVAKAFVKNPDPENKTQVNHKDGNKLNNAAYNLEWATPSENIQHAHDTKLIVIGRGKEAPYVKNSEEKIRKVCELLETGKYTHKEISKITGVKTHVIESIKERHCWLDISSEYNIPEPIGNKYKIYESQIRALIREGYSIKEIWKHHRPDEVGKVAFRQLVHRVHDKMITEKIKI